MSKSFNVKIAFNYRAVCSDEDAAMLVGALEKYRNGAPRKAESDALLAAYDRGGLEGLLTAIVKLQAKAMRAAILESVKGGDLSHFSPFTVEVTPRGN